MLVVSVITYFLMSIKLISQKSSLSVVNYTLVVTDYVKTIVLQESLAVIQKTSFGFSASFISESGEVTTSIAMIPNDALFPIESCLTLICEGSICAIFPKKMGRLADLPEFLSKSKLLEVYKRGRDSVFLLLVDYKGKKIFYTAYKTNGIWDGTHHHHINEETEKLMNLDYDSPLNKFTYYKDKLFLTTFNEEELVTVCLDETGPINRTNRNFRLDIAGQSIDCKISDQRTFGNKLLITSEGIVGTRSIEPICDNIINFKGIEKSISIEQTPCEIYKVESQVHERIEVPYFTHEKLVIVKSTENRNKFRNPSVVEITKMRNDN